MVMSLDCVVERCVVVNGAFGHICSGKQFLENLREETTKRLYCEVQYSIFRCPGKRTMKCGAVRAILEISGFDRLPGSVYSRTYSSQVLRCGPVCGKFHNCRLYDFADLN